MAGDNPLLGGVALGGRGTAFGVGVALVGCLLDGVLGRCLSGLGLVPLGFGVEPGGEALGFQLVLPEGGVDFHGLFDLLGPLLLIDRLTMGFNLGLLEPAFLGQFFVADGLTGHFLHLALQLVEGARTFVVMFALTW